MNVEHMYTADIVKLEEEVFYFNLLKLMCNTYLNDYDITEKMFE